VKTFVPALTTNSARDNHSFPNQQKQSSWQTPRRVLSIALYELLQQLRSIAFWMLISVCTAITGVIVYGSNQNQPAAIAYVTIASVAGRVSLILIPLLLFSIFHRDFRHGMRPLIWTRSVTSVQYASGKTIAAVFLSVLALFFPLVLSWLLSDLHFGEMVLLDPFVKLFFVMAICNIFLALFSLVWIALLPGKPLPGVIIGCATAILLTGFISQPPLSLLNMNKGAFFYSFSVGFGPDSPLLTDQAFFMLALALLCLGILMIIYQYTERLGILRLRAFLGSVLLILLAGASAISIASNFQSLMTNYQSAGSATVMPANAQMDHYTLNINADPDAGTLQGTAAFTLTLNASGSQTLTFLLNPGLQVQRITLGTENSATISVPFHSSLGWTSFALKASSFAQGQATQVSIMYAGHLITGRDAYAGPNGMNDVLGANLGTYNPNPVQSYLGQGLGMLGGADEGNWYPLPWTQQLVGNSSTRLDVENIRVHLPATTHIFSNITSHMVSGGQEIAVQPDAALPTAFLAFMDRPEQTMFANATLLYQGATPESRDMSSYRVLLQQLQKMGTLFNLAPIAHWQAIILPFLQAPIVTPGLAWLPEYPLFNNTGLNMQSSSVATGLAAQEIAFAWWTNALTQNVQINSSSSTAQQPAGSISIRALYHYPVDTTLFLSYYSSVAVAYQSIGHSMQQHMFAWCQSYTKTTDQELDQRNALIAQMMQYGFGSCSTQDLSLFSLEQSYGQVSVEHFMQQLADANRNQILTIARFIAQASTFFHHDVTSLLAPNLCLSTPTMSSMTESFEEPMMARSGGPQACSSNTGGTTA
jgi:hypothetical protein